jgi:ectoine hydroxylase-related dioxygenase (phytanoyl-CoA dioxygenase family)
MFNLENFIEEINNQGYSIVRNALPNQFVELAKMELIKAIESEVDYHKTKEYSDYGMVLLCSRYHRIFCDIFDIDLVREPFNAILGEGCIVYAYTSSSMPPNLTNYSCRIHTDCPRIIPGYVTNIGATILLDDFTESNGATYFLPYSQGQSIEPNPEYFYQNSFRLIEKAGSICFFNARLWHSGGRNLTSQWRHALTINMCRPWMKQRIDIPRAMSNTDISTISSVAKQKLGFFAQVPSSYQEYYSPIENRKFKQKVE